MSDYRRLRERWAEVPPLAVSMAIVAKWKPKPVKKARPKPAPAPGAKPEAPMLVQMFKSMGGAPGKTIMMAQDGRLQGG